MKFFKIIMIILILIFSFGCKQKAPTPTLSSQNNLIKPGDIIVTNGGSRSLILLDSDGVYKSVLYDFDNSDTVYGINFKHDTKEIIFTINGAPRVGAISVVDGTYRNLISDINLSGVIKGLTQLNNGDILVAKTTSIERFTTNGVRLTSASPAWPMLIGVPSVEQISATKDGGFITCTSEVIGKVKKFSKDSVLLATIVSGLVSTPNAMGCIELVDGKVAMAFSGTAVLGIYDQIMTVAGDLSGDKAELYLDQGVLTLPKSLSQSLNGNILVADNGFNYILEITTTGSFVRTLGDSVISLPNAVFSVPNY